jgi:hypothetical protein
VHQARVRNDELQKAAAGREDEDAIERTHPVIAVGPNE